MFAKKWILYSPVFDTIFFFGPFLATFIFTVICTIYFPNIIYPENSPVWFFIFAIVFDVGHVWGTLYRGYLQKNIFSRHWKILAGVPILSITLLAILTSITISGYDSLFIPLSFLAYIAVFHFIKQQIGFVLLYDKRTENIDSLKSISKKIDILITWIITGFPFLYWMMNYENISLSWFIPGEYIFISKLIPQTEFIWIIYIISVFIYIIFQILFTFRGVKVNPMKYLYILGTAYIWFNGMVTYNSIIVFGFGNILLHGFNYYGIVIGSTYHNNNYEGFIKRIKKFGIGFFSIIIILSLILLGYVEEFFWDQFIWREKTIIFSDFFYNIGYNQSMLIIIISILGSIQLTHYILDRYIWRGNFGDIN